jgi:hypothetical protein
VFKMGNKLRRKIHFGMFFKHIFMTDISFKNKFGM